MSIRTGSSGSVRISSTGNHYFEEFFSNQFYTERKFGFEAQKINVSNDQRNQADINISYDGAFLEGTLKPGESKDFFPSNRNSVFIRSASGFPMVRIWAE